MSEYQLYTLPNGIRIAHRQVTHTKIVHCGIMLDIGSRDEKPNQTGLAHFWEHMAFKGTQKRNAFHIINRLESVGGEINAYTTKEKVCFYASILDTHFDKTVELLTDITFHSTFPEKQIEKERGVILEEMSMYLDAPDDAIQDDFDGIVFPNHPLGANILGTAEHVKSFDQKMLEQFIQENLDTERIICSIVGNIDFKKAVRVAEKYLKDIPAKSSQRKRTPPPVYTPQVIQVTRPITQAHSAIGRPAYEMTSTKRLPFFMLVNLLGGPGLNSRFNLSLREKYGLVYSVEANFTSYVDTGFMGIYFATDKDNLARAHKLIQKELRQLREKKLGEVQLRGLKDQMMGQLAMSEESNQGYMLMMAKSILDLGKVEPLPDIFQQIREVTAQNLWDLSNEMFEEQQLSYLTFMPELDEND